jgi:hypothetical protein
MKFRPRRIWGVLLLAAFGGCGRQASSALPPPQDVRLGVCPAFTNIVQIHGRSSIYMDRDGSHVAVVAHEGKQFIVYTDGQPGLAYDAIGGVAISPTGGHVACSATKSAQWFLVLDGKVGAPCDGFN